MIRHLSPFNDTPFKLLSKLLLFCRTQANGAGSCTAQARALLSVTDRTQSGPRVSLISSIFLRGKHLQNVWPNNESERDLKRNRCIIVLNPLYF